MKAKQIFAEINQILDRRQEAAIRAGYSPETANEQSARLLVNVSISKAIKHAMEEGRAAA